MRRLAQRILLAASLGVAVAAAALWLVLRSLGPLPLAAADHLSVTVLDRHGQLLRAFTTPEGLWRLPVEPSDVDKRYVAMLLAFEDRRFQSHFGVDPLALGRAAVQLIIHRRIVSGGSTLTMQVARLLEGEYAHTPTAKFRQIIRAVQLEHRLSKKQILRLYLRLAPFGGNLEGVRAASLAYFGKEPKRLSVAEAALLVALPQSPESRRPDRFAKAARRARDRVLGRAAAAGVISQAEAARARRVPVPTRRAEFPKLAPHLAETEVAKRPGLSVHRLTLDRDLQASLQQLARNHAHANGDRLSAAILVVDNRSGEILAHVGSSDYFDERRLGAIDMTSAIRSPGSTLKPIIYGMAFEGGLAHPETLIEDRAVRFGGYAPRNFDDEFHGTVTMREALAASLNIPAVRLLNRIGPARLVARMRRAGADPIVPTSEEPTLAIALGGLGLRLEDLARLYTALARGGDPIDLVHVMHRAAKPASAAASRTPANAAGHRNNRLLTKVAAWYVTDILKDAPPPANAPAGRIAYKTGTSYGYRDAWAVGYDGHHTVAAWIGRADGSSTPGLTGRGAAAPILFDAFQRLAPARTAFPPPPSGVLRVAGADLPPPLKRFTDVVELRSPDGFIDQPVQIAFPPDRSEVELSDGETPMVLKAEGGVLPLTWMVDGAPIKTEPNARQVQWQPNGRGFVKLSVIDARGRVDRATVRLR
ncbi:MAG: penicillin-binding protein 1C [Hyphomicrobiaceae bacterium]